MVDLESYISQPCRMLSIPYWKSKNIILPNDILIVHDENFSEEYLNEYTDEEYFRIYHPLQVVEETIPEWLLFKTVEEDDMNTVVSIINDSYSDLSVNITQMIGYTQSKVYNRNLWIIVYDKHSTEPIGCGIAG
ncbi:MAG: hypothetical protein LIO62_02335 [Clostridiales bacterium]|nr:hypothetical protein [Clostridiales bacterium]